MSSSPELSQASNWSLSRKILWILLFLLALSLFAKRHMIAMKPPEGVILDFFKEWSAVKNWSAGMPLYTPQEQALSIHLNASRSNADSFFDQYNAHPPTANLVCFPFLFLSYQNAHLAWNLVSIVLLGLMVVLIVKGLELRLSVWSIIALLTLLLVCDPLLQTLIQGQLNLLLAFLIVVAWRAEKSGKSFVSGICLGLATAVKIYPAYLFLYFLVRKDWRALSGGIVSFVLITLLTAAVFGIDAYRDYVTVVIPVVGGVSNTNNWGNSSLLAFWERLFVQSTPSIQPLVDSPVLLKISLWSSWIIVTMLAVIATWKTRTEKFSEQAFAITIVAMLLMAPTTWHHYFITLAFPVGLLLALYQPRSKKRWFVNIAIAALILSPREVWIIMIRAKKTTEAAAVMPWEHGGLVALPWQSLTALSYQCYALLIIIALLWPTKQQLTDDSTLEQLTP
ncbi:MAG: glycosyltransferase family 87 protein [Gimesia sp.]